MTDKNLTDVTDTNVGKMTDTEIVKVLEYCSNPNNTCDKCILFNAKDDSCQCASNLRLRALDLINRLQKEKDTLNRKLTDAYLMIDKLRGDS